MGILSIKAYEIDNWTKIEPRRAQELLPKLVCKLILASSKEIVDFHFPFEKAIQYGGLDGYLFASDSNSFYPEGRSAWEFGTNQDIKGKFDQDYEKRSKGLNAFDLKNTTFCFVTSRIWNCQEGISEFTVSKEADGIWKNVKILDANNLELWLSECPSVAMWFANIIGKSYYGLVDLESYWNSIVNNTAPKLTKEFFIHERSDTVVNELVKYVNEKESKILFLAESKIEAVLTLSAMLLDSNDVKTQQILSRVVVAYSSEGFNNACYNFKDAIIIPVFENPKSQCNTCGIQIIPAEINGPIDLINKNSPRCSIYKRRKREYFTALKILGFDDIEANKYTTDFKCRFSPLLRMVSLDDSIKMPLWASSENLACLIPALFANAWEGNLESDRKAIEILSGKTYEEYISSIEYFMRGDNAPIFNLDNSYACISWNELWDIISSKITSNLFDNYKKCVKYVFSQKDPVFELTEDKWAMGSLYGKKASFSEKLKQGLIIAMVKIVEKSEDNNIFAFCSDCVAQCNVLIKGILDNISTKEHLYTLIPNLIYLAEASPEVVLSFLERKISSDDENFWYIFKIRAKPIFGRNIYTYVLWTLERLCWIDTYFVRAVNALVSIAEKNFEYSISNSPLNSLYTIFCLWHPQGALSLDDRETILKNIIVKKAQIGRLLLNMLIPSAGGIVTELSTFEFRDFEKNNFEITNVYLMEVLNKLVRCFLETTTFSYEDWSFILKNFSTFYNALEEMAVDIKKNSKHITDEEKLSICESVAHKIGHHKKFADADWRMPEDAIAKLEEIYYLFLPDSPSKYIHYFSYDFVGLNPCVYKKDSYNYNKEKAQVLKERVVACEKTIENYGIDSLCELGGKVKAPQLLAESIISSKYAEEINLDYIIKIGKLVPNFASALITSLYYSLGIKYFDSLRNSAYSKEDIAFIVGQFPIKTDVVEFLESLSTEIQNDFWENANAWRVSYENSEFAKKCLKKLLSYNRPYSVLNELYLSEIDDEEIIIDALKQGLEMHPNTEKSGMSLDNINTSCVQELFSRLHKTNKTISFTIAQLELSYIPLFDINFEPSCLVDYVLNSPEAFIELISCSYKKDEQTENKTKDTQKHISISVANKALDSIKRLPGQKNDTVDRDKFFAWTNSVLKLSKKKKYSKACEIEIGKIMSYAPIDEDGIWPHRVVREFFEKNSTDIIIDHFQIGLINQRGVYSPSGGDEEDRLSNKYYAYAKLLQIEYPKTSHAVQTIGDSYKYESRFERARELKGYY